MLRVQRLVAASLTLISCTWAFAEPPKLLKSEPADAATDVAVDIGVVRLIFDRDMRTDSFTCWKSPQGEFPPVNKDVESRWADARTFELKIQRLQPGTQYAVQLNADQRQGFRATSDEALPITTLRFKTAADKPAPRQDVYDPSAEKPPARQEIYTGETARPAEGEYALRWNAQPGQVCKMKQSTRVKLDLTISAEGESEQQHIDTLTQAEYTDTVLAVERGVPTRLLRRIDKVQVSMKNPQTGQVERQTSPYDGLEVELRALPDGSFELVNVKSGDRNAAQEMAKECQWYTLEPGRNARVGESWRLSGEQLATVLGALEAKEGEVEMRLVKVEKDPQLGKDVARLEGRLKARMELPGGVKPEAEGTLAVEFVPEVGLPFLRQAKLTLRVDQVIQAEGQRVKVTGEGQLDTVEERALMKETAPVPATPAAAQPGAGTKSSGKHLGTLAFQRQEEPRERAFSLLVPLGWRIAGGIVRVDPLKTDMATQAVAAKCDMAVQSDDRESVSVRFLPSIMYADTRGMPAGEMFPPGSVYNGCPVVLKMPADEFLAAGLFPHLRPQAQDVRVTERKKLPELAAGYKRRVADLPIVGGQFEFDSALVTIEYTDGGTRYRERLFTVLKYYPQILWDNNDTLSFRAPLAQFEQWEPVARVVIFSAKFNPQWVQGEIAGQAKRAGIIIDTQRELARIEQEITTHRQKTNAEINNDMYLTLTGQEEYVNPYTKEVERDSGDWKHRWVTEGGQIVFTDDDNYNPNIDPAKPFNRSDFKRSDVRPRFPQ